MIHKKRNINLYPYTSMTSFSLYSTLSTIVETTLNNVTANFTENGLLSFLLHRHTIAEGE